jgi:hypothetical protein
VLSVIFIKLQKEGYMDFYNIAKIASDTLAYGIRNLLNERQNLENHLVDLEIKHEFANAIKKSIMNYKSNIMNNKTNSASTDYRLLLNLINQVESNNILTQKFQDAIKETILFYREANSELSFDSLGSLKLELNSILDGKAAEDFKYESYALVSNMAIIINKYSMGLLNNIIDAKSAIYTNHYEVGLIKSELAGYGLCENSKTDGFGIKNFAASNIEDAEIVFIGTDQEVKFEI